MVKKGILLIYLLILFFCCSTIYASDINTEKLVTDNNNTIIEENNLIKENIGTFSSLDNKINSEYNDSIKLENDYEYDSDTDENYSMGIKIEKNNLVLDGQGHTINGKNSARIFQIRAENVVLKNINFINGFSKNTGGAVNFDKDGLVDNCNFTNNHAEKSGGAIWFTKNGIVTSTNFNNNIALEKSGGAIFLNTGTFKMCNFNNNAATDGGAIRLIGTGTIEQCNFYNNLAKNIGGAIYTPSAKLLINNTRFKSNKALNGTENYNLNNKNILTINVTKIGNFTELSNEINNCQNNELKLSKNYEYTIGESPEIIISKSNLIINGQNHIIDGYFLSKIFIINSNNVTLKNINFINGNSTKYVSGVIKFNKIGTVECCNFSNNYAGLHGGAIYFDGCKGYIKNCNFINNSAEFDGGAIKFFNADGVVINCNFINNIAKRYGGAIHFGSNGLVKNSTFYSNNANLGNAIYCNDDLYLFNCTFKPDLSQDNNTIFSKGKILTNIFLTIKVSNITEGENALVEITTNNTFSDNVTVQIGNSNYLVSVVNGTGTLLIPNLGIGTYMAIVRLNNFDDIIKNTTFTIKAKSSTIIKANLVSTTYATSKNIVVTLTDTNGNALKGKSITIVLNGASKILTTDIKGHVSYEIGTKLVPIVYSELLIHIMLNKAFNSLDCKNTHLALCIVIH